MDNQFNFSGTKKNIEKIKRDLPVELANDAQSFFVASWRKGGWDDGSVHKWTPPKRQSKNGKSSRLRSQTLVQSGALRRSVANSIRSKTFDKIKLVSDVPYAAYVNDGTPKMPQRKFMGDSASLRKIQQDKIVKAIEKVWQR